MRVNEVADIAEGARAAAEAALRATQSEGGELRLMLQEGIERNRDEAATVTAEEGRRYKAQHSALALASRSLSPSSSAPPCGPSYTHTHQPLTLTLTLTLHTPLWTLPSGGETIFRLQKRA